MKVLVVEDDVRTLEFILQGLAQAGHTADGETDGVVGLEMALQAHYDVMVVDRMLPNLAGLDLVRLARERGVRTPAIFLTALNKVEARVEGLNAGADDYLVKPFAFSELLARLMALARRPVVDPVAPSNLTVGDLEIDYARRQVVRAGEKVHLTAQEFKLLEFLARRPGQVTTRSMLLEGLWGFHFDPRSNIVDIHISRLRRKLDRGGGPSLIRTHRGAGYVLEAPE